MSLGGSDIGVSSFAIDCLGWKRWGRGDELKKAGRLTNRLQGDGLQRPPLHRSRFQPSLKRSVRRYRRREVC